MNWDGLAFQAIDGLASVSVLFFAAAGFSMIFGVTRNINIAHGLLYMPGAYVAVALTTAMDGAPGRHRRRGGRDKPLTNRFRDQNR
jgi:branched-subunit amino acid ABC-type transport system permease component